MAVAERSPGGGGKVQGHTGVSWNIVTNSEMGCPCSVSLNDSQVPLGLSPIPLDGQKARLHVGLNKY